MTVYDCTKAGGWTTDLRMDAVMRMNDYHLVTRAQDYATTRSEHHALDAMLNRLRINPSAKLSEYERGIATNLVERAQS